MIFEQLFDNNSSTYTYIIASRAGAEGLIIDPVLDNVNQYIKILNKYKLQLVKVIDTHIHADHISGASELKDRTNCTTIIRQHTTSDIVEIKLKDNTPKDLLNTSAKKLNNKKKFKYLKNFILNVKLKIDTTPIKLKEASDIKDEGTCTYIILTESP